MRKRATAKMSEQTQRFVLKTVYEFERCAGTNATQAANLMDAPQATILRAFDELEVINPGWFATVDTVRRFDPGVNRKDFLQMASTHLFNPVVREYRLGRIPTARGRLPLSGISAISHHSGLADNPFPTFAITKDQERDLGLREGKGLVDWNSWGHPACVIQVMRYRLDSMDQIAIDPISSILSLSDEQTADPRVERAAAGILKRTLID